MLYILDIAAVCIVCLWAQGYMCSILHFPALHCTALQFPALHCTALHFPRPWWEQSTARLAADAQTYRYQVTVTRRHRTLWVQ